MEKLLFIAFLLVTAGVNGQSISSLQSVTSLVSVPKQTMPELCGKATYSSELYTENKKTELPDNDTTIAVYYKNKADNNRAEPMYLVNGKHISALSINTIDPSKIETINIGKNGKIKGDNGKIYMGEVSITLKKSYIPSFMSVHKLLEKHTNIANTKAIIFINDVLIDEAYNSVIIDEKYVLSINVYQLDKSVNGPDMTVVRIALHTKENVEKRNDIRIRGVAQYTY